jgi:kumamolisin
MTNKRHMKLPRSKRGRNLTAIKVGGVNPKDKVMVTIGLRGPKIPSADQFIGQTMTREELAENFGARKADADKVAKCLKKFGLKVKGVSLETRSMRVSGTAKAMEAAFKPDWAIMRSPSYGTYRGRQGTIQIPAELKGIVTGVFGLDERRMAHRRSGAGMPARPRTTLSPLAPADIEKRYNFPEGDGEGQNIAIAEFGGGFFIQDVIAYCKKFQRRVPKVQTIDVLPDVPDSRAFTFKELLDIPDPERRHRKLDESFEVMMDVEIIAGLCPKASISVYFSTFNQSGWINLLERVIHADPVPVALSISWGRAEDDVQWSSEGIRAIDDLLNQASRKGITICVASGDDGCRDEMFNDKYPMDHVDFPSSSPHVMGVGGTMLKRSGTRVKEVTWADPKTADVRGGATGGGVSRKFPCPNWQRVQVAPLFDNRKGRVVPDVSALAGQPYYDLVFSGLPWPDGKTSASAPVWAALVARIDAKLPPNKRQRFMTPLLYKKLANGKTVGEVSFRDITLGKNETPGSHIGYNARPGFDAATGWGVPDGVKLLNALANI